MTLAERASNRSTETDYGDEATGTGDASAPAHGLAKARSERAGTGGLAGRSGNFRIPSS
jgi:hypothetical protein